MTDCQFYILTENLEIHKIGNRSWLIEEWQQALLLGEGALLVIDEIQKVRNWSTFVWVWFLRADFTTEFLL